MTRGKQKDRYSFYGLVRNETANLPSFILIRLYMNVKYFPLKDLNTAINGSGESRHTRITLRDYVLSLRERIYNVRDKSTNSQLNIILSAIATDQETKFPKQNTQIFLQMKSTLVIQQLGKS